MSIFASLRLCVLLLHPFDLAKQLLFSEYASGFAATNQDVQNIYTCIDYMRFMPGEKHLLFFSPSGLMLSRVEYEDSIAAFANDARVAINVFQVGGCCSSWYINAGMRNVAQQTGGQASIGEYARQGLARLNEVTMAEYLLGYYPKNDNWDGAYRNIEIDNGACRSFKADTEDRYV